MKYIVLISEKKRVAAAFFAERLRDDFFIIVQRSKMITVLRYRKMNALVFRLVACKIAKQIFRLQMFHSITHSHNPIRWSDQRTVP